MKSAIILMVLLGCDCDAVQCEYIRTVAMQWQSIEACQTAIGREIKNEKPSYPLIMARCVVHQNETAPPLMTQINRPASEKTPAGTSAPSQAPESPRAIGATMAGTVSSYFLGAFDDILRLKEIVRGDVAQVYLTNAIRIDNYLKY